MTSGGELAAVIVILFPPKSLEGAGLHISVSHTDDHIAIAPDAQMVISARILERWTIKLRVLRSLKTLSLAWGKSRRCQKQRGVALGDSRASLLGTGSRDLEHSHLNSDPSKTLSPSTVASLPSCSIHWRSNRAAMDAMSPQRPQHRRNASSKSNILRSLVSPRARNEEPQIYSPPGQGTSYTQKVPILPPDHPHGRSKSKSRVLGERQGNVQSPPSSPSKSRQKSMAVSKTLFMRRSASRMMRTKISLISSAR